MLIISTWKLAFKYVLMPVSLFALVIFFQNCSVNKIQNLTSAATEFKTEGGNGEPYDGKLRYTRLVPGLTCENKDIAIGELEIHGDMTTLITNQNSCRNISEQVLTSTLELSSFSDRYIGQGNGVYTLLHSRSENIQKRIFTEAWCRAMKPDRSGSVFEFAVEWQESGALASLSIMTEKNPTEVKTASLREIDIDRVFYKTSTGALTIYLDQKIPGTQKVAGSFLGMLDGIEQGRAVECRMGGQFDAVAPEFKYPGSTNKTVAVGENISGLIPVVNKSLVQFTLSPALPSGLNFDPSSGAITGASQALMPRQKYLVSAIFPFGQVTRQISIGVGQTQIVDQTTSTIDSVACTNASGGCDLHGAISLANKISPTPLIIQVKSPSINFSAANLVVTGDISIVGSLAEPSILDAKSLSRHFQVLENARLELIHLKLINGKANPGGSINTVKGSLLVRDSSFFNNVADEEAYQNIGGAIYSDSSMLEILDSNFENNSTRINGSSCGGGAIYIMGRQSTTIRNSNFKNNKGQHGGALAFYTMEGQIAELSNNIFEGNYAMAGGAIYADWSVLSITDSQFLRNTAIFDAGAISFSMQDRSWILRSVFDGNSGAGFGSAAIYWQNYQWATNKRDSALYILDSKFTNHHSDFPAAVILNYGSEVVLRNVELSKNTNLSNCKSTFERGEFLSLGGNHSSDSTCPE